MIRPGAWAFVILMLAVAAAPAPAPALSAGTTMMPMTMPVNGGSGQHGASPSSGCPCGCGMPLQAASAVPARTAGAEPSPCPGPSVPAWSGTPAGRLSGIRRIYRKNVLDHPERAAVHALIVARPGIDSGEIAASLAMNRETLRYHLGQLESAGTIVVLRDRGIVRYFENHGRYTLLERKVLRHLWNQTGTAILSLVAARPGITQSGIAAELAVTAPTVRWYMHRFSADGIVTAQREGRYTRYSLAPEAGRFVPVVADRRPELPVLLQGA